MSNEELQEVEAQEVEDVEAAAETESNADIETSDGTGLAPDTSAETDENTDPSETPEDKAQKAINSKHRQFKQEERKFKKEEIRRLKAEADLDELKQSRAKSEQVEEVQIPELLDSWDENFDKRQKERDDAIRKNEGIRVNKQIISDRLVIAETEKKVEAEKVNRDKITKFLDRGRDFNIKEDDLAKAASIVSEAQIPKALEDFLVDAPDGPLLVAYLADANSDIDLYELRNMNSIELGLKIPEMRAKAQKLKPKSSSAPAPAQAVRGKATGKKVHPLLEGAIIK
jgi:hypothetical protein